MLRMEVSASENLKKEQLLSVFNLIVSVGLLNYGNRIKSVLSQFRTVILSFRERNLSLRCVPRELMFTVMCRGNTHVPVETSHFVLIPSKRLNNLHLPEGGWAYMIIRSKESGEVMKRSLVQVIPVEYLQDFAIISDIYFHNLDLSVAYDSIDRTHARVQIYNFPALSANGSVEECFRPVVAQRAVINVLQNLKGLQDDVIDAVLFTYFLTPKYFVNGDVFSVDLKLVGNYVYLKGNVPWVKYLYFKVTDITGPEYVYSDSIVRGYLIDSKSTSIVTEASDIFLLPKVKDVGRDCMKELTVQNLETYIVSKCPTGLLGYFQELRMCFKPFLDLQFWKTCSGLKPCFLLFGPDGVGKREIVECVCASLGVNLHEIDCQELLSSASPHAVEGNINSTFSYMRKYNRCVLLMRKVEYFGFDSEKYEDSRVIEAFLKNIDELSDNGERLVFIVATCDSRKSQPTNIAPAIYQLFLSTIHVPLPTESERKEIISWLINKEGLRTEACLEYYAHHTPGFSLVDLKRLLSTALKNRHRKQMSQDYADCRVLEEEDFKMALAQMNAEYVDSIGSPKVPLVSWEDVGGLHDLKKEIYRTVTLPIQHSELMCGQLKRSGILLYGPPGTGKTLVAKAVATECKLNFLAVKGPELLDMYIGQSEENVREVFARARSSIPCIIFFDEIDSLAPSRGKSGDSGGVMDRVVSQLLAEMDGLEKCNNLFIIGATNRPDLIDPALLRPGRFDKLLYVGAYEHKDSQLSVLKAQTRKFHLKSDIDLSNVVAQFPSYLTGADIYSLCSDAWMNAAASSIHKFENGEIPVPDEVEVGEEDFIQAVASFKPSVNEEDKYYFKQFFKNVCS